MNVHIPNRKSQHAPVETLDSSPSPILVKHDMSQTSGIQCMQKVVSACIAGCTSDSWGEAHGGVA